MNFSSTYIKELCLKTIKTQWSESDIAVLQQSIFQNRSVEGVSKQLNRSEPAVISKGNELGYGYYTDKVTGQKYFKKTINHKHRRTQADIQEGKEFMSAPPENQSSQNVDIEDRKNIIPKIEIDPVDIDFMIQILTMAKNKAVSNRTNCNNLRSIS